MGKTETKISTGQFKVGHMWYIHRCTICIADMRRPELIVCTNQLFLAVIYWLFGLTLFCISQFFALCKTDCTSFSLSMLGWAMWSYFFNSCLSSCALHKTIKQYFELENSYETLCWIWRTLRPHYSPEWDRNRFQETLQNVQVKTRERKYVV